MIGKLSHIGQLSALMRRSQVEHGVVSANIANLNTPKYHARDVKFDQALADAIRNGDEQGTIIEASGLIERPDGNNVDIDRELAKLTRNELEYQTYTQIIASQLGMYRTAISGRT